MMRFTQYIDKLNTHPWDKVSHTLLSILFGIPVLFLDPALAATAAGTYMLYGREQVQSEKKGTGMIRSWFFWNWNRDGVLDVVLTILPTYLTLKGLSILTGIGV